MVKAKTKNLISESEDSSDSEPIVVEPKQRRPAWVDKATEKLTVSIEEVSRLRKLKKTPQRIVIGPWTHGGNNRSFAGDVAYGDSAAILDFLTDFHLRWFDHHLKGKANGVDKDPAVQLAAAKAILVATRPR